MWKFKCPNLVLINNDLDPMTIGGVKVRCNTYKERRDMELPFPFIASLNQGELMLYMSQVEHSMCANCPGKKGDHNIKSIKENNIKRIKRKG